MKKKHELSRSILKLRKVKVKEKSQIKAKNKKNFVLCTKIRVQSKTLQFLFFLLEFFLKEKSTETLFPPERETLVTGSLFLEKTRI